jgi:hypothetical protein
MKKHLNDVVAQREGHHAFQLIIVVIFIAFPTTKNMSS